MAYQQFLYANGIKASDLRPGEYSDYLGTQELYNGDLVHFSRSENIKEVWLQVAAFNFCYFNIISLLILFILQWCKLKLKQSVTLACMPSRFEVKNCRLLNPTFSISLILGVHFEEAR